MDVSFMILMDVIGTIAFAISGAMTAARKGMDIFGVNILAVTTAVGGGAIRDILLGNTPPIMFRNPMYVLIAVITANIVFGTLYFHKIHVGKTVQHAYEMALFWFDTLGLASFTVNGAIIGIKAPVNTTLFLEVFLGVITGVGGGLLRDVMAQEMPAIFVKHVYAVASLSGALFVGIFWEILPKNIVMMGGFIIVVCLRFFAKKYNWNLPRIVSGVK